MMNLIEIENYTVLQLEGYKALPLLAVYGQTKFLSRLHQQENMAVSKNYLLLSTLVIYGLKYMFHRM